MICTVKCKTMRTRAHTAFWRLRRTRIGSDVKLTFFSYTDLPSRVIMDLQCCDDIVNSTENRNIQSNDISRRIIMFSVLSLNINDFGGINHHLMEYKRLNWKGDEVTDWDTWKKCVDKKGTCNAILHYIKKLNPSILVLQEFEVNNSVESKQFANQLCNDSYEMISNMPKYKASITAVFAKSVIKSKCKFEFLDNPNTLDGRSCAFQVNDIIIYGTHVPPKGDTRIQTFWGEIKTFYKKYADKKMLLIGDFNTINEGNRELYNDLLHVGGCDIWLQKGYEDSRPTCGDKRIDIAIASPNLLPLVTDITICPSLLYKGITDHAALIVDINAEDSDL